METVEVQNLALFSVMVSPLSGVMSSVRRLVHTVLLRDELLAAVLNKLISGLVRGAPSKLRWKVPTWQVWDEV